jgi:hypothetical protein
MTTVEQSVEWQLAGETKVLRENLSQCHFVHYKCHTTWRGLELRPPSWGLPSQNYGEVNFSVWYQHRDPILTAEVPKNLRRGLVSLWLYKGNNKLRDWKNVFTLHIPPWAPHTYDFVVLTSLTHPRKILLVVLQIGNRKSQRLISNPKYKQLRPVYIEWEGFFFFLVLF